MWLSGHSVLDGLGIAYVPEPYARAALARGRLVAVLSDWCPVFPGLFLYFPGNRHIPAGLRAFIDLLKASSRNQSDASR